MELLSIFILWIRRVFWSRDTVMYLVLWADNKYYFSKHTLPWAIAPTTTVIGSSLGTRSLGFTKLGTENEVPSLRQPTGRWSVIGFRITFSSFIGLSVALTLNLWSSCTEVETETFNVHSCSLSRKRDSVQIWSGRLMELAMPSQVDHKHVLSLKVVSLRECEVNELLHVIVDLIFLHNILCFKHQESTHQARQSSRCCYVKLHNTVLTYNTKQIPMILIVPSLVQRFLIVCSISMH